jgi:hypothetical protein
VSWTLIVAVVVLTMMSTASCRRVLLAIMRLAAHWQISACTGASSRCWRTRRRVRHRDGGRAKNTQSYIIPLQSKLILCQNQNYTQYILNSIQERSAGSGAGRVSEILASFHVRGMAGSG